MWLKRLFSISFPSRCNSCRYKPIIYKPLSERNYSKKICKILTIMDNNTVYLRHQPNEPQVQINFQYKSIEFDMDRLFNFSRSITETINTFAERIRTSVEKEVLKQSRRKKVKPKDAESNEKLIPTTPKVKNNFINIRIQDISAGGGCTINKSRVSLSNYFRV